ncbi:MAG: hypothetical protein Q8J62_00875, partial [Candidatus Cloacimonadaceae bacterium]|nr:hypothetical protein [Candidatus Cloacimonadaceae bacterium]
DRVLSAKKYAELQGSAWQILHKHVYELVNEGSFSVLYNERMGRPNVLDADARKVSTGLYIIKQRDNDVSKPKKFMLLK